MIKLEGAQYGMAWLCACVLCACVLAWVRCVCVCVGALRVCVCAWVLCVFLRAWVHIVLKTDARSPLLNLKAAHIYQMALTVAAV